MPRGIKVHGAAEIVHHDGFLGSGEYLAITPRVSWSWGIVGPAAHQGQPARHKIVWPRAS